MTTMQVTEATLTPASRTRPSLENSMDVFNTKSKVS